MLFASSYSENVKRRWTHVSRMVHPGANTCCGMANGNVIWAAINWTKAGATQDPFSMRERTFTYKEQAVAKYIIVMCYFIAGLIAVKNKHVTWTCQMKQHKKTCKGRIRGKQNNMSVGMSESEMMSEDLSISISECCCLEVQVTEEHAETRSFHQSCPPRPSSAPKVHPLWTPVGTCGLVQPRHCSSFLMLLNTTDFQGSAWTNCVWYSFHCG